VGLYDRDETKATRKQVSAGLRSGMACYDRLHNQQKKISVALLLPIHRGMLRFAGSIIFTICLL
jgi:hypothetical protein